MKGNAVHNIFNRLLLVKKLYLYLVTDIIYKYIYILYKYNTKGIFAITQLVLVTYN